MTEFQERGGGEYRLDRIEKDIAEIKASIMALQSNIAALQVGMQETYVLRREFNDHVVEKERRFREVDRHVNERAMLCEKDIADIRHEIKDANARTDRMLMAASAALASAVVALLQAVFRFLPLGHS